MTALTLDRFLVPFGRGAGLAPVSLEIAQGERVALVGASGAGKTSLLRAIAGLGATTGGAVRIAGREATALPPERRDAVYLQQTPLLFPHMSVAENVAFPLRVRGVPADERRARVGAALAAVQLADLADRRPHTLSGGQRHRAALARAVVGRPAVLLLDEPLAALDPVLRAEVRDAVLTIQREYGPALLLVTHDLDEAALIGNRIGVLLDRALAQLAPPAELFTFPASLAVARFLGGFVEIPGSMRDGVFHSVLGPVRPARGAVRDGPAIGVARRDAFRLGHGGAAARVVAVRALAGTMQVVLDAGEVELTLVGHAAATPRTGETLAVEAAAELLSVFAPEAN